jgi:hypothetical protein
MRRRAASEEIELRFSHKTHPRSRRTPDGHSTTAADDSDAGW